MLMNWLQWKSSRWRVRVAGCLEMSLFEDDQFTTLTAIWDAPKVKTANLRLLVCSALRHTISRILELTIHHQIAIDTSIEYRSVM